MPKPRHRPAPQRSRATTHVDTQLRVIGGTLRRRTIHYNGDLGLRPMKDRVRESLFNLLGPQVVGTSVIDLFAGTGAMSFESLSRGAKHAWLIERHFPTVRVINETAASLEVTDRITAQGGDAFRWGPRSAADVPAPWLVFCCPPYDFYVSRQREILELIDSLWQQAASGSMVVVESDNRFNPEKLPDFSHWDVREYLPAVLAIGRKS